MQVRNYLFDKGIFPSKKVGVKIISVGNLTVGGSGKTPTVIYVSGLIKKAGYKVGILSRGYGRKSKGYLLVSDGKEIKTKVNESGDEILLAAEECSVPAAVSERRVEGARRFIADVDLNAIVLDDAYQHRWIHRDLNILVFDQRFLKVAGRLEQKLLPLGWMREPWTSIDRADVVIINRKFSEKMEIPEKLLKHFEGKKIFNAYYRASGFYDVKDHKFFNLDEFGGQKSLVLCGIAQPHSFIKVLKENKINTTNKLIFNDHRDYNQKDVQVIRKKFYESNTYSVLTTHKDAVKLTNFAKELDDIDIYYLKIEMDIENGDEFNQLIKKTME